MGTSLGWGWGGAALNGGLGERSGSVYVYMQLCGTFVGVCPAGNQ